MTEYLYDDNKPLNSSDYRVKVGCMNCDAVKLVDILKGMQVEEYISKKKIKCPSCECTETLVSYTAYRANKAMMNQLMNMAKQEAETEGKLHGHYG